MKKTYILFAMFVAAATVVFAQEPPARTLFIEGRAAEPGHHAFFLNNFNVEAAVLGFHVTPTSALAAHTLRFDVQPNADPLQPHIIMMSLIDNETNFELLSWGWPFAGTDEVMLFNQFLVYFTTAIIPAPYLVRVAVPFFDDNWQRQRFYLRMGVSSQTSFYRVLSYGLVGGRGIYAGDFARPSAVTSVGNMVFPHPGTTVGLQWLFIPNLSFEFNSHFTLGDPTSYQFVNIALGAQLAGVIRTNNFMFQPYAAARLPLLVSDDYYHTFPSFLLGGGLQISTRAGRTGGFFVDVNFMTPLQNVQRRNRNVLTPNPATIHYSHFVLGLGVGYKFGFSQRD